MKHIAIFGPTAIGKSSLAVKLSLHLGAEVISADSSQIYKEMNVGTAKISKQEMRGVKHHLIDILSPGERFDVGKFARMSDSIIKGLEEDGRRAVVVGGTGLYIKALTEGLAELPTDEAIRARLEKEDPQFLHDRLREIDWEYAEKTPPNNVRRVIRALEVYELTGMPFTYSHKLTTRKHDFYKFALIKNRESLYSDISLRVEEMFREGLVEEVEGIYEKYSKKLEKINAIGYNELFDYFKGDISKEEAKEEIKKNSKNYAKKQLTWLASNEFDVIDIEKMDPMEHILNSIKD